MAIKVRVPNGSFNGIRGGVVFTNGVGIFEDEKLGRQVADSFGYEVIEEKKKATAKKTTTKKKSTAKKTESKKE